jgi:medium-chain acyl-[acyl-carrier-protein] hydrolase
MRQYTFKKKYTVHSYEVDTDANVLLTAIGNYIQDIAGRHAEILGFGFEDMIKKNQYWVLSRLRIQMMKFPVWNEEVAVETWPSGIDRIFANRDFRILNGKNELIGDASSAWLIIDRRSRRPQNPEALNEHLPDLDVSSDKKSLEKLPSVDGGDEYLSYQVKYSDLDQNNHVNNVKYIQWILDSYPDDFRTKNKIVTFEINFLSESSLGEKIKIKNVCLDQSKIVYHHALFLMDNEKEICRARITWAHTG